MNTPPIERHFAFVTVKPADSWYDDLMREEVLGVFLSLEGAQASIPEVVHGKKRVTVDGWRQGPDGVWWYTNKTARDFREGGVYIAEVALLP